MNLTLTPRTIAIGHLVNLYATDEDLSLGIRQHLAIMLIELVSGSGAGVPTSAVEPGLRELSDAVASLGSRELDAAFAEKLRATELPDDVWALMSSLGDLVRPKDGAATEMYTSEATGRPMQLEPSSVLGLFVRRTQLAFRRASFEKLSKLTTHLREWVEAGSGAAAAKPAAGGRDAANASKDATPPAAGAPPPLAPRPGADPAPPWAHALPEPLLSVHVQRLAKLLEEGAADCDADTLEASLDELLASAPHAPQVQLGAQFFGAQFFGAQFLGAQFV